jgi:hypothetical protein
MDERRKLERSDKIAYRLREAHKDEPGALSKILSREVLEVLEFNAALVREEHAAEDAALGYLEGTRRA